MPKFPLTVLSLSVARNSCESLIGPSLRQPPYPEIGKFRELVGAGEFGERDRRFMNIGRNRFWFELYQD
jgi:hypothetical protein